MQSMCRIYTCITWETCSMAVLYMFDRFMNYMYNTPKNTHVLHVYHPCNTHFVVYHDYVFQQFNLKSLV